MEFAQLQPLKNGAIVIVASGEIFPGDGDKFAAAIGDAQDGLIYLASPGGQSGAALKIGAIINRQGLTAIVAKGYECSSACALAWLGARTRGLEYGAIIGFHGAYAAEAGQLVSSSSGNAIVGAYLSGLGLSIDAIAFITEARPSAAEYLTPFTADKYSIRAGFFNPNNQVEWHGGTAVAAAQPAPTPPAMDAKAKARETAELPNIDAACHTVVDARTYDYSNCYRQETDNLRWAIYLARGLPEGKAGILLVANQGLPDYALESIQEVCLRPMSASPYFFLLALWFGMGS